jgi:hypothetical protein
MHPLVPSLLEKARNLIAKGWTQHTYHTKNYNQDKYCMLGAVRKVASDEFRRNEMSAALRSHLPEDYKGKSIPHFNDADSTTKDKVLEIFDNTIKSARGE